ncbi:MAG: arginine deiminase family protein [Pseudomonadota bacterium]|nr:arginine deiminase family protein [Pseudomonadota bacterium]
MLLDFSSQSAAFDTDDCASRVSRWGASSETGRLTDVLLSAPPHLTIVPCNEVSRDNLAKGLTAAPDVAERQHDRFAAALQKTGVRCHFVPPVPDLPDLSFTRDSVTMSPWGLIELRPAAEHRRAETSHVAAVVRDLGVPIHDRIKEGTIEGGDVCLLRESLVLIGHSGERTDKAGANALGAMFAARGWEVIHTRFDPVYLHLDTILTVVADDCAVVCLEALDPDLLARLRDLGIELIPATTEEVAILGANLLSLGDGVVVAPTGNDRVTDALTARGFDVIKVEIDQFTQCGGGPHCLTMPLARHASR